MKGLIVYDLGTFHTDRSVPYCASSYQICKVASYYDPDSTPSEYQKRKKKIPFFLMEPIVLIKC